MATLKVGQGHNGFDVSNDCKGGVLIKVTSKNSGEKSFHTLVSGILKSDACLVNTPILFLEVSKRNHQGGPEIKRKKDIQNLTP